MSNSHTVHISVCVAVGLAAIRPLKHEGPDITSNPLDGCSGFGRYQAVETCLARQGLLVQDGSCSGFGRYQAVETPSSIPYDLVCVSCIGFGRYQPVETDSRKTELAIRARSGIN